MQNVPKFSNSAQNVCNFSVFRRFQTDFAKTD